MTAQCTHRLSAARRLKRPMMVRARSRMRWPSLHFFVDAAGALAMRSMPRCVRRVSLAKKCHLKAMAAAMARR